MSNGRCEALLEKEDRSLWKEKHGAKHVVALFRRIKAPADIDVGLSFSAVRIKPEQ